MNHLRSQWNMAAMAYGKVKRWLHQQMKGGNTNGATDRHINNKYITLHCVARADKNVPWLFSRSAEQLLNCADRSWFYVISRIPIWWETWQQQISQLNIALSHCCDGQRNQVTSSQMPVPNWWRWLHTRHSITVVAARAPQSKMTITMLSTKILQSIITQRVMHLSDILFPFQNDYSSIYLCMTKCTTALDNRINSVHNLHCTHNTVY